MSDVRYLGDVKNNANFISPEQLLARAADDIKNGDVAPNKLIILALDDRGGQYNVSWRQCGMSMSECVSLAEFAKHSFIEQMDR